MVLLLVCYVLRSYEGPIKDTTGLAKLGLGPPPEELEKIVSEVIPLGRMGTREEVAMAAVFLASPAASFVSGTTLIVDGGAWLYSPTLISRDTLNMMQQQRKSKL